MTTRYASFLSTSPALSVRHVGQLAWAGLWSMVRARETRRLLAEMDGRLLADIGLSRSDATMEAARPFWDISARR